MPPEYLGPVWDAVLLCSTPGSMSPRLSPLLIPSRLRLRRSPEVVHLLRPKAPAPASMTGCYPDNVIDAAPGPGPISYRGWWHDGMTKRLLSAPVTAPLGCIPRPKLIRIARFVSVIANSSVCLHNLFQTRAQKKKSNNVELIPENLLLSLSQLNCKICLSKFFSRILWEWMRHENDIEKCKILLLLGLTFIVFNSIRSSRSSNL